ncbi:hypothetical protein GCM10007421_16870 [Halopseudomonas oceani]|nr:hypothetical protein GCM10007421_16870 [Halopseudomonas oceani]
MLEIMIRVGYGFADFQGFSENSKFIYLLIFASVLMWGKLIDVRNWHGCV